MVSLVFVGDDAETLLPVLYDGEWASVKVQSSDCGGYGTVNSGEATWGRSHDGARSVVVSTCLEGGFNPVDVPVDNTGLFRAEIHVGG